MRTLIALLILLLSATTLADEAPTWERPEGAVVGEGTPLVLDPPADWLPPVLDVSLLGIDGSAADLDELVDRVTVLFYFSATCPHCIHVAPEINELHALLGDRVTFIGVGSGNSSLGQLRTFGEEQQVPFPIYKDFTRRFGSANQATSTPQVFVVRPRPEGGFEKLAEWRPFASGFRLLAELRLRRVLGEDPWGAFQAGRYEGSRACGACHITEFGSWGLTHHSIAYWTLYDDGKTGDAECVSCHVVGLGKPSAFVLGDHASPHADVGCEACHGAGGPHAPGGREVDATKACTGCHTPEHSLLFDLQRALPLIDHWVAARIPPEEFTARREALTNGTAARPLTDFPEGANVGSEACVSCHEAEAKLYAAEPHGDTRASLKKKAAARDAGCLRCHATARVKAPRKAADFHPGTLGCESCHGPGERHVAEQGGKGNIVALGSSCPVCVLEAVCTSCHDAENDPDWDIDTALPQVSHGSKAARSRAP